MLHNYNVDDVAGSSRGTKMLAVWIIVKLTPNGGEMFVMVMLTMSKQ